jgi:hypothetical protein
VFYYATIVQVAIFCNFHVIRSAPASTDWAAARFADTPSARMIERRLNHSFFFVVGWFCGRIRKTWPHTISGRRSKKHSRGL